MPTVPKQCLQIQYGELLVVNLKTVFSTSSGKMLVPIHCTHPYNMTTPWRDCLLGFNHGGEVSSGLNVVEKTFRVFVVLTSSSKPRFWGSWRPGLITVRHPERRGWLKTAFTDLNIFAPEHWFWTLCSFESSPLKNKHNPERTLLTLHCYRWLRV